MTEPRTPRRGEIAVCQLILLIAVLTVWEWSSGRYIDTLLASTPSDIYAQSLAWLKRGVLQRAAWDTTRIVAISLLAGGSIGLLLGLLAGASRRCEHIAMPFVKVGFALPKVALIPLFILWFGTGDLQKFVLASLTVSFFFFFAGYEGMRSLPQTMNNVLHLYGATPFQRLRLLYLPASLGWTLASMRIAVPYAFVAVTSAEIVASAGGLGLLAKNNAAAMNTAGTFSAIACVTLLGAASGSLVGWLARRTRWRLQN